MAFKGLRRNTEELGLARPPQQAKPNASRSKSLVGGEGSSTRAAVMPVRVPGSVVQVGRAVLWGAGMSGRLAGRLEGDVLWEGLSRALGGGLQRACCGSGGPGTVGEKDDGIRRQVSAWSAGELQGGGGSGSGEPYVSVHVGGVFRMCSQPCPTAVNLAPFCFLPPCLCSPCHRIPEANTPRPAVADLLHPMPATASLPCPDCSP